MYNQQQYPARGQYTTQYNPMMEIEAKLARLEQLQLQQSQMYPNATTTPQQPQIEPQPHTQHHQPQVFSVENEQQARDYHVPENGLVILLMKDGSKVFAKSHNTKDWKTDFSIFNKQDDILQQINNDNDIAPSDAVEGLQTEIKEIKKLLKGVVKDVQSIRETSAIRGDASNDNEGNTKRGGNRKSNSRTSVPSEE